MLRRLDDADRAAFAAMNRDPRVVEHLLGPLTSGESDALLARIEEGFRAHGYGPWAVEVVGGARFVGIVGLSDVGFRAPFTPTVEVSWRLTTAAWAHGYATEAASAIDDGFARCRLDDVVSFTSAVNRRSRAVMERLGMVHDPAGDFAHPGIRCGHPLRAHVLYRFEDVAGRRRAAGRGQAVTRSGRTPATPGCADPCA